MIRAAIHATLSDSPMTMRELSEQLGQPFDHIRNTIGSMRQNAKWNLRIVGYRRDADGGRLYLRAVWGVGRGKDAVKPPKLNQAQTNKRSRQRRKAQVASVFHLPLVNENAARKRALSQTFLEAA
jgi:hypothetical protein